MAELEDTSNAPFVVVPNRPGPLTTLSSAADRDEIDDALDDLFGEPDDRGPGVTDAVLVTAGAAAAVVGIVASLPVLVVGGVAAAALGAILPLRELWRRIRRHGSAAGVPVATRDGVVLRVDGGPVGDLVGAYGRVFESAARVTAVSVRAGIESAAHSAAYEVASLLDGQRPGDAAELEYVRSRARALGELAHALAELEATGLDAVTRRARIEARREIEEHAGSSLDELSRLTKELRDDGRR